MNVEPSVKWQQHSAAHAQPEPCCTDLSPSLHISTLSLNFSLMSSKWKASGSSPLWAKTRYFSEVGWDFCTGTPHCLMVLQRQRYVCGIWWGPLYSSMCVLLNLDFRNLAFWKCSAVGKWECTGSPWKDHMHLPRRCIISGRMHPFTTDAVLHLFLLKHSATYTLT